MSKNLKDIKRRFIETMRWVSDELEISTDEISRDLYTRTTVDFGVEGRLNKEELNLIGGFKKAKNLYLKEKRTQKGPKILIFDVETAPIVAYVWSLWDQNVGLNQIEKDWHLLSWSAKWLGDPEDKVMYQDQRGRRNKEDDKELLKGIWKLLDEADIVIGQNSKSFDHKKLNARFIMNGMKPPSSYRHIDTKILAKRHFGFTSNRLEYMTDKLCTKYKKQKHAKFFGFYLWLECMKDNMEAWEEMEMYNKYDVLSLEELYYKLIPWDNSINFNVYSECVDTVCTCGNEEFKHSGFYYTNTSKFDKYQCTKCGSEVRGRVNLLSKEKRKSLKAGTQR
jgi:hypothetical protein